MFMSNMFIGNSFKAATQCILQRCYRSWRDGDLAQIHIFDRSCLTHAKADTAYHLTLPDATAACMDATPATTPAIASD